MPPEFGPLIRLAGISVVCPPKVGPGIRLAGFSVCLLLVPSSGIGCWCLVVQRGMGPDGVVLPPPFFSAVSGFFQRVEPLLIEAFLPHPSIKRLEKGMIGRRARATEREFDPMVMRPRVTCLRRIFWASVHLQDLWQALARCCPLQDRHHPLSGERAIDFNGRTLTTPVIHYPEAPKALPVRQAVAHARPCSSVRSGACAAGNSGRSALTRFLRTLERTASPSRR
jgi:hypothetical protein